ncbi:MAG TPA: glycosyltransferase family 2 protein [Candidatus Onthocola stercorigallinarum]|nr:glycosyltransferase family 2 protein [Candidatus Onthocola stercorigallinarum]
MKKELLSIIVNCYNEEETIPIFYDTIVPIIEKIKNLDYEIIFIDDCSSDKTLEIIKNIAKKSKKVKYLSTTRRFGKEAGILAGYEHAKGDYIVSIDVDLQDPPELIVEMYNILKKQNYDCVATRSVSRNGYSFLRKIFTKSYYFILRKLTPLEMKEGIRDFRMVTRRVAKDLVNMKEYNRYSRYLFEYLGYKTYWIEFDNQERVAGKTKWNFFKLFQVAMEAILTSSNYLLYLPIILGIVLFIISIIMAVVILFVEESLKIFILTITLFIGSLIIITIGINALYISKMYLEIKNRPKYVIKESNLE